MSFAHFLLYFAIAQVAPKQNCICSAIGDHKALDSQLSTGSTWEDGPAVGNLRFLYRKLSFFFEFSIQTYEQHPRKNVLLYVYYC